tara:strand:+ start:993 stop:1241 length:249 start_codon:yes stop_codon:yes gene_type:complete
MRTDEDKLPSGDVIRDLRKERGLNKSQLARGAGITLGALWKYENGRVEPGRAMVRRLAEGLGMDPVELERSISAAQRDGEAA